MKRYISLILVLAGIIHCAESEQKNLSGPALLLQMQGHDMGPEYAHALAQMGPARREAFLIEAAIQGRGGYDFRDAYERYSKNAALPYDVREGFMTMDEYETNQANREARKMQRAQQLAAYAASPWYQKAYEGIRRKMASGWQSFKDAGAQRVEARKFLDPEYRKKRLQEAYEQYSQYYGPTWGWVGTDDIKYGIPDIGYTPENVVWYGPAITAREKLQDVLKKIEAGETYSQWQGPSLVKEIAQSGKLDQPMKIFTYHL